MMSHTDQTREDEDDEQEAAENDQEDLCQQTRPSGIRVSLPEEINHLTDLSIPPSAPVPLLRRERDISLISLLTTSCHSLPPPPSPTSLRLILADDQPLVSPTVGLLVLIEEHDHAIHEKLMHTLDLFLGWMVTLCHGDRFTHDSEDRNAVGDWEKETPPEDNDSKAWKERMEV